MASKIAAFLLPILAFANPVPQTAPGGLTVARIYAGGNGCPQGTVTSQKSEKSDTTINFVYRDFKVAVNEKTERKDRSRYCDLTFDLTYPSGVQYAVVSATYSGYAKMDQGVVAAFDTAYFFASDGAPEETSNSKMAFTGGGVLESGQYFTKQDSFNESSTVWSPCTGSGTLTIDQRIELSSVASGSGEVSVTGASIPFTQRTLHLQSRACTPSEN